MPEVNTDFLNQAIKAQGEDYDDFLAHPLDDMEDLFDLNPVSDEE